MYRLHHQGEKNRQARNNLSSNKQHDTLFLADSFHHDDGGSTSYQNVGSYKNHTEFFIVTMIKTYMKGT
jgi:hypothetical protein